MVVKDIRGTELLLDDFVTEVQLKFKTKWEDPRVLVFRNVENKLEIGKVVIVRTGHLKIHVLDSFAPVIDGIFAKALTGHYPGENDTEIEKTQADYLYEIRETLERAK